MIKRTCKQCGKDFTLTDSEVNFYKSKDLDIPKRCSECRKKNKDNNNNVNKDNINNFDISNKQENNNYSNNRSYNNNNNNKKKYTFGSVIAAGLVVILLLVGKVFNITPNWGEIFNTAQSEQSSNVSLEFRNEALWEDHFLKHRSGFVYSTKEEYLKGANEVINSATSLHKFEAEDNDEIYYDESKNEIVFVSSDGYIRTYFRPSEGINYYNRQ